MKQAVIILLICATIAIMLPLAAKAAFSLVPCGRSDQAGTPHAQCQLQHLIILIIRVINYLISMAGVVAIYFVLTAGFGLVLAMGKPEHIQTNKDAIQQAVVGLGIVFMAFVFVNLLVNGIFGTSASSRKWWDPGCLYDILNRTQGCPTLVFGGTGLGGVTPPGAPISGNTAALAGAILNNLNIDLSTDADCGAPNHAQGVITAISDSEYPPVCSPSCTPAGGGCSSGGTSGTVTVNPAILSGLLELAQTTEFRISSLTTGQHSAGSAHYSGEAVDIVPEAALGSAWAAARDVLNGLGGTAFCENTRGAPVPNCVDDVDHIHWTLALGAAVGAGSDQITYGQCSGIVCSDAPLNICAAVDPRTGCYQDKVEQFGSQITAGVLRANVNFSSLDPAKMLKAIMANESEGGEKLESSDNSSFGLFHLRPATTQRYQTACNVPVGTAVDRAWLVGVVNSGGTVDTEKATVQACMAALYLKDLTYDCGNDPRQLAAGYNGGLGACLPSANCQACDICPNDGNPVTRRWECLWDDNAHQQCNADRATGSYKQTRQYAPRVQYCYDEVF